MTGDEKIAEAQRLLAEAKAAVRVAEDLVVTANSAADYALLQQRVKLAAQIEAQKDLVKAENAVKEASRVFVETVHTVKTGAPVLGEGAL